MIELVVIGVIFWIVCGFMTVGIIVADFQGRFPLIAKKRLPGTSRLWCVCIGLSGPIGLVVSGLMSGFCEHGWYIRYKEPRP